MTLVRPERRASLVVGAVAGLIATSFVLANLFALRESSTDSASRGVPYVRLYDHPSSPKEVILNQGDGQAFAALALDPTLSRPEVFRGGRHEAAYRAQRPLLGWLAWATSLGDPRAVPEALLVWAVIGYSLLGAVATAFAMQQNRVSRWAIAVLALPGALITLDWTGPEALGLAAALSGVLLWHRERPSLAPAAALFALAGLCRETLLLVPLALLVCELIRTSRSLKRVSTLVVAPAIYCLWVLVVHYRLDAWPTDASAGRLSVPFAGVAGVMGGWRPVDLIFAIIAGGLAIIAARHIRSRPDEFAIILVHVLLATCLGGAVWGRVEDFGRVLLPLYVFGILILLPNRATPATGTNISS